MQWFLENKKPFILSSEEHARVIPTLRPERPRHQCSSRSTSAFTGSRRRTSAMSSFGTTTPPLEGPSTELVTSVPPTFTHSFGLTFHAIGPSPKGFSSMHLAHKLR
ncbi:hypothetical protein V6N13_148407 [Hibiscus sabdariffa]